MLFHKYGGENVSVTNCMSHVSMFLPINATVKFSNENMGDAQLIWIILYRLPECPIIYPVRIVYYCTGHPYNTISLGALKFYLGFQKFTY